jgi:hypothetical protein
MIWVHRPLARKGVWLPQTLTNGGGDGGPQIMRLYTVQKLWYSLYYTHFSLRQCNWVYGATTSFVRIYITMKRKSKKRQKVRYLSLKSIIPNGVISPPLPPPHSLMFHFQPICHNRI